MIVNICEPQPAPSWVVSSVGRALHLYRSGHGFKSRAGLNFFRPYFHCLIITAKIAFIFTGKIVKANVPL